LKRCEGFSRVEATRRRAEFVLVVVGLALVIAAISARQSWLDRHFLPSFFIRASGTW